MYIQQFAGSLCLVILFFSSFTPTTRREAGANVNKLKLLPLPSYTEKNKKENERNEGNEDVY